MVHRLADEQRARVAKSSAGRSRRPRIPINPRQGTSTTDAPDSTTAATTTSPDPSTSSSHESDMTTRTTTTTMHDTTVSTTESPSSTSHSMVDSSTTQNDPKSSTRAGPSSDTTPTPSTTTRDSTSEMSTTTRPTPTPTPTTTSSIIRTTTPTTTTPLPTTTSSSPDTTSTPDPTTTSTTTSSEAPKASSTSSSRLTTTPTPTPQSSTSPSDGSTTSITTPASSPTSSSPESSSSSTTPPVSTPASTTPDSTPSPTTTSTDPPVSETETSTPQSSAPVDSTSTPAPIVTSTGGGASAIVTTTPGPVVTSGSVILSSASDIQVSFTTTNSLGQTTVDIPPLYTTTYTSTSNGVPLTITAVVSQATTLNTDGGGSTSPFFKNKGAVAGVFIVVGIAGAAIILFGIFTFLRRRKMRRLTREAAIAATLGSGRTPFVDDDDADGSGPSGGNSTEMGYHSASDTRPVFGTYGTAYGGSYGYGPDPFYSNPPAGKSFNASPPGSIDQHGPNNPQGLLPPAPYTYGPTGAPNLSPTTPLLSNNQAPTAPPASPPSVYSNMNIPKGYEYDYSNYVPPSAVDGLAGRTLSPSPTSPTFSKRSSLPMPPPGAAAPNYAALAAAAGLVSESGGLAATNVPPSAYQGLASSKARRTSNTPSFASSASRYSVDPPPADQGLVSPQTPGLPSYSAANVSKSNSGHSVNASTSNHSHGGPSTPAPDALLGSGIIQSPSGEADWRAGGRPETPLFDHRLDPDTILSAKGRSPATGNRLSDYSTPSEESLGSFQDHQDYSRRVLQVTNPS